MSDYTNHQQSQIDKNIINLGDDPFAASLEDPFQDGNEDTRQEITLSKNAAQRIAILAKSEGKDEAILRLTVSGGGCSGYQYHFDLINEIKRDDFVTSCINAKLVTDQASLQLIAGSELDYIDDLVGAYFTVTNPNARSSCGCGTSFSL